MSEFSRKACARREAIRARERATLRDRVFKTAPGPEAVAAALKAAVELGPETGFTIAASRGGPFEAEWFDLAAGRLGFDHAAKLAREFRADPRLAGFEIRIYAGLRESGFSLRQLASLPELL